MKKPLLITALMLAVVACFAQTSESLKPKAQTFSTELNVNPFNGQVNLNNSLNQIKLRYFATPTLALRLGFNISRKDSVNNVNNPYGVNSYFSNNERKSSTFGFNVGVEKHFAGTKRLSPYIGADVSYTDKSSNQTINDNGSTTTVSNAWYYTYYSNTTTITQIQENGYTRYGLNVFTGFDFYIAQHFYFGYEFNFSLNKTDWKTVTVTTSGQSSNNNTNNYGKNSAVTFGPSLINGIRLGYSF